MKEDDGQTPEDQSDDGHDLDESEPELELAEDAHGQKIRPVKQDEGHERRQPLRDIGEPVLHVDPDGGQLGHGGHDPHEPVRPAGHEPVEGSAELIGIRGKRAGDRPVRQELSQRAHDEEDRYARNGVGEQQPRARLLDGLRGAQEQAHADGASQGDELDMPTLQVPGERASGLRHITTLGKNLRFIQAGQYTRAPPL